MATNPRDLQYEVPGRVLPGPGAGPPLTELVVELRRAIDAQNQLALRAARDLQERRVQVAAQANPDGSNDVVMQIYEVPQGALAYLIGLAVEQDGATPATPTTSATLWHAIYGCPSGGSKTIAQVIAQGQLLACQPDSPAADTQLPYVYNFGDSAPSVFGPGALYLVADSVTAARVVSCRGTIKVCEPSGS